MRKGKNEVLECLTLKRVENQKDSMDSEEFLLSCSHGAETVPGQGRSLIGGVGERYVMLPSEWAPSGETFVPHLIRRHPQWRRPSITSLARRLSICLLLQLVLGLCTTTAMAAVWEALHELKNMAFPSPGLICDLVLLPRCTLQPCGDTSIMSILFQHRRGSVLIPSG